MPSHPKCQTTYKLDGNASAICRAHAYRNFYIDEVARTNIAFLIDCKEIQNVGSVMIACYHLAIASKCLA